MAKQNEIREWLKMMAGSKRYRVCTECGVCFEPEYGEGEFCTPECGLDSALRVARALLDAASNHNAQGPSADFDRRAWYFGSNVYVVEGEYTDEGFEIILSWWDDDEGERLFESVPGYEGESQLVELTAADAAGIATRIAAERKAAGKGFQR